MVTLGLFPLHEVRWGRLGVHRTGPVSAGNRAVQRAVRRERRKETKEESPWAALQGVALPLL
jgi:hypothetical protein